MSAEPLDALLEKLIAGDGAAAEEVFRSYEPFLRMVVRRQLSPELRAINPAADIAPIDFSAGAVASLLMHGGFDAADSKADPTHWLAIASYEAYGRDRGDADGCRAVTSSSVIVWPRVD